MTLPQTCNTIRTIMKQLVNTIEPKNQIEVNGFIHRWQFIGMEYNDCKYILVPLHNDKLTFSRVDDSGCYFSEFDTVKEALEYTVNYQNGFSTKTPKVYVFGSWNEMIQWINEK